MLEAETSSSSKNPKHHHGEESISETEDAEMSDLQDDRSPSPHHDAHEVPIFPPENLNSPIPSNASVSEVTIEEVEDIDAPGLVLRQLWLHSGFSREPTSANMLAELSHIWL
jgi:hypothetical protein